MVYGLPSRSSLEVTAGSAALRGRHGRGPPGVRGAFESEFPAIVRSVYVVCQDLGRAEDLTQDAFLELLRHWGRVSRYDRPGPGSDGSPSARRSR